MHEVWIGKTTPGTCPRGFVGAVFFSRVYPRCGDAAKICKLGGCKIIFSKIYFKREEAGYLPQNRGPKRQKLSRYSPGRLVIYLEVPGS